MVRLFVTKLLQNFFLSVCQEVFTYNVTSVTLIRFYSINAKLDNRDVLYATCPNSFSFALNQVFIEKISRWGHSIHMLAVKWFLPPRLTPTLMRLMGWAQWKYATSKAKAQ